MIEISLIIIFTDHCTTDGRADYYFLSVGEMVEAKIKPRIYKRSHDCTDEKTVAECFQSCVYRKLIMRLECQAPWMNFEGVEVCPSGGDAFSYLLSFGSKYENSVLIENCLTTKL